SRRGVMAVGGVSFPTPQAYSGGIDWSPLSNLGNVYRQAQERDAQQSALAQLGNDPAANAQILIKSGVPSLAQLGINMQNQLATRAESVREWEAQNARAQAAENRAQSDWEKKAEEEAAAAKLISGLVPNRAAPSPPIAQVPAQAPAPTNVGPAVPL